MAIVETTLGKIEGNSKGDSEEFLGIPYAKPPIGKLRFRAPQTLDPWASTLEAKKHGGAAPQDSLPIFDVGTLNEDCLYLNVWTPKADNKKRPVLFWIHGGGFFIGSSAQKEYNGTRLSERGDVVIVSINYRLGALGFAYLQDLLPDSHPTDTNLGIRDQVAALQWVRDHITNFGGDPNNITIFGESAGGMSVGALLGIPSAEGLFHKAIPQSGAGHTCIEKEDATRVAESFLNALEIDPNKPDKLWEVSTKEIVKAQRAGSSLQVKSGPWKLPLAGMTFVPVIDGDLLPNHPITAVEQGLSKNIPLLIGSTAEEWKLFGMIANMASGNKEAMPGVDSSALEAFTGSGSLEEKIETRLPGLSSKAVVTYKKEFGDDCKDDDLLSAIDTDRMFTAPAVFMAEAQAKHQSNTYMYRFDWRSPTFGACHAIDIPFIFGDVNSPFGLMFTGGGEKAETLRDQVQDAWISFAKTGNPSHNGIPQWNSYEVKSRATMVFNKECAAKELPSKTLLDFWREI